MNDQQNDFEEMHRDPDNWKWGFIYFNPKDKRILVLKRIPAMGMTLNFGNPYTGIVLFWIIVVFLLIAALPKIIS